jgi:3-phenylpropionate/trans-cinnamate dioxygenase ferredoxin subunit
VSDRFMTVAKVGEIPEGGVKVVRVDDDPVAVFHVGGQYYALADLCTHDGGELSDGELDGHVIECARHGARFDIRTGAVLAMPATGAVPRHAVRVIGDQIQVACETCDEREAAQASAAKPAASTALPAPSPPAAPPPGTDSPGGQSSARRAFEPPAVPEPAAASAAAPATGKPAPSLQEFAVRAALETVMDPEIQLSVVDLGLIREVVIEPGRTLVRMMLTTPFCPYAPQLTEDVKQAAMSVVAQPCEVEILPDAWSPELMPDPGLLGFST